MFITNSIPIRCEPYQQKAEFKGDGDSFCLHVLFFMSMGFQRRGNVNEWNCVGAGGTMQKGYSD